MTHKVHTQDLIALLPPGIDRALLGILAFHQGREAAISRGALVHMCASMGFSVHERAMRAAINQLRKQGHMICSTGGEGGGYYMATNWLELTDYLESEVRPRALDLLEQEKALQQAAEKTWGQYAKQESLF